MWRDHKRRKTSEGNASVSSDGPTYAESWEAYLRREYGAAHALTPRTVNRLPKKAISAGLKRLADSVKAEVEQQNQPVAAPPPHSRPAVASAAAAPWRLTLALSTRSLTR